MNTRPCSPKTGALQYIWPSAAQAAGEGHCPFRVQLSYATLAYDNIIRIFSSLNVQIEMALPYGL
jgi:hypothetical protein